MCPPLNPEPTMPKKSIIAHRNLALVWCDSAGSLAEVLATVDLTDVPHQRFGNRGLAVPAPYAVEIRRALHAAGSFPRVVGDLPRDARREEEE